MAKIPIDVNEVLKASGAASDAREQPVRVAIFVDTTATQELSGLVQEAFAPASTNAFLHVESYFDLLPAISGDTDLAVIVAGNSPRTGELSSQLITSNIATVVCCVNMTQAISSAAQGGYAIAPENIVSLDSAYATYAKSAAASSQAATSPQVATSPQPSASSQAASPQASAVDQDPASTQGAPAKSPAACFRNALGDWVISHFHDKRIAFAAAFAFVRYPLATEITKTTALQNGVVGAALFIPGADMPVMTLNQMKMVLQVAAAYGQPLGIERAKELAVVLGGGFALRAAARQVVGLVPALGWAIKAGIGYSGTIAMGYAARDYFDGGGRVEGLAGKVIEARDKAVEQAQKTGQGAKAATQNVADGAKSATRSLAGNARGLFSKKGAQKAQESTGSIVIEPLAVEDAFPDADSTD